MSDPREAVQGSQEDFLECYRGRQSALHHMAYMRMAKVLVALQVCKAAGVSLEEKEIFDYGFGAGTFLRHCPPSSRLSGVEIDPQNVEAARAMLQETGHSQVDLQPITIEKWEQHPLLQKKYDVVLCSHVLEHLPDPAEFLRTIQKSLADNGVFVGLVPINERARDPHHIQTPNRSLIHIWTAEANMEVVTYMEADPWIYWVWPLYLSQGIFGRLFARGFSISLGIASTLLGPDLWLRLSKLYAALTAARPTQAAFVLKKR